MSSRLRLRTDVLNEKAEEAGDRTSNAIAKRAGVQASTITRLVAGETTPTVATLVALGNAYKISLDDLVVGAPEAEQVPA